MGDSLRLGCIFLASGYARRFGQNKLLADFQGRPMIDVILEKHPYERFCQTVVVTRYPEIAVSAAIHGCTVVENEDPTGDIARTIRSGIAALMPGLSGCMFSVCDQPLLTPASIHRLVDAFWASPDKIVALGSGGRRGNPVIFPAALLPELASLPSGESGSAVIRRHPGLLQLVEAGCPAELWDVDRPEDLSALPKTDTI